MVFYCKEMNKPSILDTLETYLLNFLLAFFSFSIASALSVIVNHLPAKQGLQISNANLAAGYNPEENYVKVLFIIIVGFLAFLGLRKLVSYGKYFRWFIIVFLTFSVFAITLMPAVESNFGNIDTFHRGEQLSPAQAFGNGKKLYTGMFVLHGAGDDVLLPYAGLHLPGTNARGGIGSYFFIETTFQILSVLLFFIILSKLFRSTAAFVAVATWFTLSEFSIFYYIRDIFAWSVVLGIGYLLLRKPNPTAKLRIVGGLGFLASSTYFYAVDRGFITSFAVALTAALLVLFVPKPNGWQWDPRFNLNRIMPALYGFGGAVLAQLIGLVLLGISGYSEYLRTTFVDIPKYEGYLFNSPLPKLQPETFLIWLPVLIALVGAVMLYGLMKDQLRENGRLQPSALFGFVLLLTSIIFLRGGYGRPDFGHIAYASPLLFVAVFYISTLAVARYRKFEAQKLWPAALIVTLLFWPVPTIPVSRITDFASMKPGHLTVYLKLPRYEDKAWLPQGVQQITSYIQKNTRKNDPIFVFTQQPIYYYLADRPNPTRYYIPWFADPGALTPGMLHDLQKNPPKIILYSISNGVGWDSPDGYTMAQRTPEVNAWIMKNYHQQARIGTAVLLKKN
jgi:hypothetical protein